MVTVLFLILSVGTAEAVNKSLAVSETIRLIPRLHWEMVDRYPTASYEVTEIWDCNFSLSGWHFELYMWEDDDFIFFTKVFWDRRISQCQRAYEVTVFLSPLISSESVPAESNILMSTNVGWGLLSVRWVSPGDRHWNPVSEVNINVTQCNTMLTFLFNSLFAKHGRAALPHLH